MTKARDGLSRRDFLKLSGAGAAGLAGVTGLQRLASPVRDTPQADPAQDEHGHDGGQMGAVGQVDYEANGFEPLELLYDFDYGRVHEENGRTVREWTIVAVDKEIEIAPGLYFPAWVYGSQTSAASRRAGRLTAQCPGPTLRCVEGEHLRIHFVNGGTHPHTIHFHGIHSAQMDGVPGVGRGMIQPGGSFTYEFDARPFGCHLYHCHAIPLKRHVHKGLYGAFIVDPDPERYEGREHEIARTRNHQYTENEEINEMVMVMNGFDTNFDGDNEVYAVNSIAFAYGMETPIPIRAAQRQRVYLVNITEFDPINSFHLHANFFDYYDHGTTLEPTQRTMDTIMQCQAQRGILEFSFDGFEPGLYMFHAHQSEFAELGWMGFFKVEA
ncbi:MAG TPA: multicopper oxidase domain-containing protein [Candidatus Sulfomarinibacteraceae bacterium]|nr:multicopper oxidase domain-containing protein [Candidatus Sulfomarinibacteraceae bacterium]